MFHNYFFLRRLANELIKPLLGASIVECYSQNKDELILSFLRDDDSEFYIRANLDASISLLSFPESLSRSNRNSVELFEEIGQKKVVKIDTYQYERSFYMLFENDYFLIFKMHNRRSNILLSRNDKVFKLFRNSLSSDLDIVPSDLDKQITIDEKNLQVHDFDPTSLIPALGKEVKFSLEKNGFYDLPVSDRWQHFTDLLNRLLNNPIYLIEGTNPAISLIDEQVSSTKSAIEASEWLYQKQTRKYYFIKEKGKATQFLKQKLKRSESYISKTASKLLQLEKERNPEEIANILMANLHQLQEGLTKAVLNDFYNDSLIEIKLNTKLSPQKNAENYYRKGKNRQKEIDQLATNIKEKEKLIDEISRKILTIEDIEDFKELKKVLKSLGINQKSEEQQLPQPYHRIDLDDWKIFVGKNAKANDELTLKVAKKNDLWLHAKDVAGSHVVVKQKPGQNFPKFVIEKAAALAAYYSKRKTDTLCPVIYTEKKFVRKQKGSAPGEVIVEKEDVIMVEPSSQ